MGEDPRHGLPGVQGIPRKPQYQLQFGNEIYHAAKPGREELQSQNGLLEAGVYSPMRYTCRETLTLLQRTCQEMLLSCRSLVFTETQIYFQCVIETSIESISPGLTFASTSTLPSAACVSNVSKTFEYLYSVFPHGDVERHVDHLNDRLREYYQRQLSFGTDAIDVFLGIMSFYHASNSTATKLTQFYGVMFDYRDASDPDLPRASFLHGLLWSTKIPQNTPYVVPHTFPSWDWASVKASQPAEALGELVLPHTLRRREYGMYREIEVRIWHRVSGSSQIADFPNYEDDYKHFMPWIDIATWTRPYKVTRLNPRSGIVSQYSNPSTIENRLASGAAKVMIHDPLALEKAEVHAICLKVTDSYEFDLVGVSGLLVVETELGLYRRVAMFQWDLDLRNSELGNEIREEVQRALGLDGRIGDEGREKGKSHVYDRVNRKNAMKRLKEGGYIGPQVLGRLSEEPWQRRTIGLI